MTRIIAIRPEPGLSATIDAGRKLGLDIIGQPLFEIEPVGWEAPDPDTIDALLIGSANAVRHGGKNLVQFAGKPAYAVGKATEKALEDAGFEMAATGTGGLQNVLDRIASPMRLLRVTGEDHVALSPPAGVEIETVVAYRSVAKPLDPDLFHDDKSGQTVLLHSGVAAAHFASECNRLELNLETITIAALAPRIASSAGKGWGAIHVSDEPNDVALLAMVRRLCQD